MLDRFGFYYFSGRILGSLVKYFFSKAFAEGLLLWSFWSISNTS
jgi:hypothetical protein